MESHGAPAPGAAAKLTLKVKSQDGNAVHFEVKKTTQFAKLMNIYCTKVDAAMGSVHFLFDGTRIRPDQTPEELEMEDEDEIDVMPIPNQSNQRTRTDEPKPVPILTNDDEEDQPLKTLFKSRFQSTVSDSETDDEQDEEAEKPKTHNKKKRKKTKKISSTGILVKTKRESTSDSEMNDEQDEQAGKNQIPTQKKKKKNTPSSSSGSHQKKNRESNKYNRQYVSFGWNIIRDQQDRCNYLIFKDQKWKITEAFLCVTERRGAGQNLVYPSGKFLFALKKWKPTEQSHPEVVKVMNSKKKRLVALRGAINQCLGLLLSRKTVLSKNEKKTKSKRNRRATRSETIGRERKSALWWACEQDRKQNNNHEKQNNNHEEQNNNDKKTRNSQTKHEAVG